MGLDISEELLQARDPRPHLLNDLGALLSFCRGPDTSGFHAADLWPEITRTVWASAEIPALPLACGAEINLKNTIAEHVVGPAQDLLADQGLSFRYISTGSCK